MEDTKKEVRGRCSFNTAAHWSGTNLVLINAIPELDETIYEQLPVEYDEDDNFIDYEVYQWFATNLTDWMVEWQREHFPQLIYVYSEKLEVWVLCVTHYGTAWDYVPTDFVGDLNIPKDDHIYKEWLEIEK